jgi:hypothetical protein
MQSVEDVELLGLEDPPPPPQPESKATKISDSEYLSMFNPFLQNSQIAH